jgi:type III pantothenate kinase
MSAHLVIDAGNTLIKFALFEQQVLQVQYTWDRKDTNALQAWLANKTFEKILLSDVSGQALPLLTPFLSQQKIQQLSAQLNLPFQNLYATPHTLGADRMALVAGAMALFPQKNCLIIDAGTCVTYDLLSAEGNYLGGNITPGLQMRLKAMHTFTGKLPLPDFNLPLQVLGNDTVSCLQTGAYFGLIGEIEWLAAQYQKDFADLHLILTGGDAQLLAKRLKTNIFANPQLLLHGLNKIISIND